MLSRFDEYLIHQTSEPLLHPVSMDRNLYDRYWLGGFGDQAEMPYFGISLGVYPNRQVMDGGFSVVHRGTQYAFFGSRRAPDDRADTTIGPFSLTVLDPMRALRLQLRDNDSGIRADLIFRAHTACVEEDRQVLKRGRFTQMDVTRFTQFGCWEGEIHLDGERIAIDPDKFRGIRDRSWGRRGVGEPDAGMPAPAPQVYFLWLPVIWSDHASLAVFFEDARGHALHAEGKTIPWHATPEAIPGIEDPDQQRWPGVSRQLVYAPGTRRASQARIALMDIDGTRREIEVEPLLRYQMKGTGYGHPQWRHGLWKGELATGADRWRLDELDPLAVENLHIQQLVRCRSGERTGYGLMEQLCIGPHRPSGFEQVRDGGR